MTYDQRSVRTIIYTLCLVVLAGAGTVFWLALHERKVDALVATIVTNVIALLIPSPLTKAKSEDAQDVQVVNEPTDPVPVEGGPTD